MIVAYHSIAILKEPPLSSEQSCQCEKWGYCDRRKCVIPQVHWEKCQSGEIESLDLLWAQHGVKKTKSNSRKLEPVRSTIGTELAIIIKDATGEEIQCEACQGEILRLNKLLPEQVLADIDQISDGIVERGRKLLGWWNPKRWAVNVAPNLVRNRVKEWIREAIDRSSVIHEQTEFEKSGSQLIDTVTELPAATPLVKLLPILDGNATSAEAIKNLSTAKGEIHSRSEVLKRRSLLRAQGVSLPKLLPPEGKLKELLRKQRNFSTVSSLHRNTSPFEHACVYLGKSEEIAGCGCSQRQVSRIFHCNCESGPELCCLTEQDLRNIKSPELSSRVVSCSSCAYFTARPKFVSLKQLTVDIQSLLEKIPSSVTNVVGVARSGLQPASLIAMMLHLPLDVLRQNKGDVISGGNGWRLGEGGPNHEGDVLVVDDTCMTGNSVAAIKEITAKRFPERNIIIASVYANPLAKTKPDIWAKDLPWPHILEWNLFNSVLLPSCAFDMDGILCRDCDPWDDDDGERYQNFIKTVRPKYLVRKKSIPLIVTARLEKYRSQTQEWLKHWGIQVDKLVMGPWSDNAERAAADIAAYKAKHYATFRERRVIPGPHLFIESDPMLAESIAKLSGGIVVCPSAERCFFVS